MARGGRTGTPHPVLEVLTRIEQTLRAVLTGLAACCVLVLLLLVAAQIASRELGLGWLAPADELVTLIFAWLVFLGLAVVERDGGHLRVELLDSFLRKRPRTAKVFGLGLDLLKLVFLYVMLRSGWAFYRLGAIKISPTLGWPETIWYFSLPFSAVLMIFYTVLGLARKIMGHPGPDGTNGTCVPDADEIGKVS